MVKSMTGYGRSLVEDKDFVINVEVKTVNHRYLDIALRLPRELMFLEEKIRKLMQNYITRGRVDVVINIERKKEAGLKISVNKEMALSYLAAAEELDSLGISNDLTVSALIGLPEVVCSEKEEDTWPGLWDCLEEALKDALAGLVANREAEGGRLTGDIRKWLQEIEADVREVERLAPGVIDSYRKRLLDRVLELTQGENLVDEGRLLAEVVLYAERSDINEELVRINSHLKEMLKTLEDEGPVGRKLDFIVQEIHREINTIGSKANEYEISKQVVEIKSKLEKIKEQVQNIE
ncbi:MAG TPA: YicC family protein [Firmicutes bacterium]|nr:YicC family protein [Bacillota bacterium]